MKQIYFATTNLGKLETVRYELSQHGIEVVHEPLDLPEPQTHDLQAIAAEKVKFAFQKLQKPCIALDAGFYIHSLKGFPQTFVKFALETIGIKGLLKLVNGLPRSCEFRHCVAYMDETLGEPRFFEAHLQGTLTEQPRGAVQPHHWSQLSVIFVPSGLSKTLAEMTKEEYQQWKMNADDNWPKFAQWLLQR